MDNEVFKNINAYAALVEKNGHYLMTEVEVTHGLFRGHALSLFYKKGDAIPDLVATGGERVKLVPVIVTITCSYSNTKKKGSRSSKKKSARS